MENVRDARFQQERHSLLIGRVSIFSAILDEIDPVQIRTPEWDMKPHLADFVLMHEVRAILDDPGDHEMITDDNVAFLRNNLQAFLQQWYKSAKDQVINMLSGTLRLPDDVEDPVSLAIAVFSCRDCRENTLRFPELLAHSCLRGIRYWRGYHDLYTTVATDCANVLDMPGALDLSSLYSAACTSIHNRSGDWVPSSTLADWILVTRPNRTSSSARPDCTARTADAYTMTASNSKVVTG